MAKRIEIDCDMCHKQTTDHVVGVDITVGWQTDAAGGPGCNDYESFELCSDCAAIALAIIMKQVDISYDDGKEIVKRIKNRIKKKGGA